MVSLIITTFNRQDYLNKVLNSMLGLSIEHEIVVSDDTNIDSCISENKDIIEGYKTRGLNIRYIKNKYPNSPASNKQNGLEHSVGDWVIFVDQDDTIDVHKLELLSDAYFSDSNKFSCIITYYNMFMNDEPATYSNNDDFVKLLLHGKVYNREFLLKNNIRYDITAPTHEDVYFNYWVFCATINDKNYTIPYVKDEAYCFYNYFINDDSITHSESDFMHRYIIIEPKWFLEKFDGAFYYAKLKDDNIPEIFDLIKNELCYSVIMYLMMNEWNNSSTENELLYKDYFENCKEVFKGKVDKEILSKIAVDVMTFNALIIKDITLMQAYFNILKSLFY